MKKIWNLIERIRLILSFIFNQLELFRYNEFTIENFFRKKGLSIGKNNRIFIKNFGSEPFLIRIGNHSTISGGVKFITHDGGTWIFRDEIPDLNVFGVIEIKDNCFIGLNSIILPNVTIGPNSVVGAGSVVSKDVPPNTIVAGVPAKVISSTENYKEKCLKKWNSQNLKGSREGWKNQLIDYFWENDFTD